MNGSQNNLLPDDVDPELLYGNYDKQADDKHRFHMKTLHKAANVMEDEDTNINNTKTVTNKSGVGWKERAVLGVAGLGAGHLMTDGDKPTVPQQTPAPVSPADSEYDVLFFDADGNRIDIPRRAE